MDKPALTEHREMLADLGLSLPGGLGKFLDRLWPLSEKLDQLDTGWIGEHLAEHRLEAIELAPALVFIEIQGNSPPSENSCIRMREYSNTWRAIVQGGASSVQETR